MRTIFVNGNYEIVALDSTDRNDVTAIEVNEEDLCGYCDAALLGFKYEPSYAEGANGELVQSGCAFYPFVDYSIIRAIQNMYDKNIVSIQENNDQLTILLSEILFGESEEEV